MQICAGYGKFWRGGRKPRRRGGTEGQQRRWSSEWGRRIAQFEVRSAPASWWQCLALFGALWHGSVGARGRAMIGADG